MKSKDELFPDIYPSLPLRVLCLLPGMCEEIIKKGTLTPRSPSLRAAAPESIHTPPLLQQQQP